MIAAGFWDTVQTAVILSAAIPATISILFLVLLALPQSHLRRFVLRVISTLSILTAMAMVIYVVSPLDFVPDGIPVAGALDDLVALLIGLGSGGTGLIAGGAARRPIRVRHREIAIDGDSFQSRSNCQEKGQIRLIPREMTKPNEEV